MSKEYPTISEARSKLEHFCAYQERCHDEVITKLRNLGMDSDETDKIIVQLIADNYLNEERFARSFARGKHRIKQWGKVRIVNELKFRHISAYNIKAALSEISSEEYQETFDKISERNWEFIRESNPYKKRKKFCDYLLRKGFESELIYEKVKYFENCE